MNFTGLCSVGDFVYDELTDDNRYIECSICLEPWREPAEVMPCKHIFCKRCIEMLKSEECPECREPITRLTRPNRVILAMLVHLYGTCRRCGWHGTLECYESHAKECGMSPPISSKQFTCGVLPNNSSGRFAIGRAASSRDGDHVDYTAENLMRARTQSISPVVRGPVDANSGQFAANCEEAPRSVGNILTTGTSSGESTAPATSHSFHFSGAFSSGVGFGEVDDRTISSAPIPSTSTTESLFDPAELYPNCRFALTHDSATVERTREQDRVTWCNTPWILYGLSEVEYNFALTVASLLGLPDDRENISTTLSLVDTRRFLRMMNLPSLLADISQLIRAFYPTANVNGNSWRHTLMPRCPRLAEGAGQLEKDKEQNDGHKKEYSFSLHQLLLWVGSQHRNAEMLYDLCPDTYYRLLETNLTLDCEFSGVVTSVEHFAHLFRIAVDMPSIASTPSNSSGSASTFIPDAMSKLSVPLDNGYLATSKERFDTLMESTRRLVPYGYPQEGVLLDGVLVLVASDREGFVFCEEASEVPMARVTRKGFTTANRPHERAIGSDPSNGMRRAVSQPFDFFGKSRRKLHPATIFQRIFATQVKKRPTTEARNTTSNTSPQPAKNDATPHEEVEDDNTCANLAQTYAAAPTDDVFTEARKFAQSVARFFNSSPPTNDSTPQNGADEHSDDRSDENAAHSAQNDRHTVKSAQEISRTPRTEEDRRYQCFIGQEEEEDLPEYSTAHINSVSSH